MPALQDIHIGLRLLRRAPLPTGIALVSIALSVGATAVVFAAVRSVLIDPLPYRHPERLVLLRTEFPRFQQQSHGDWVFWNDTQEVIRRTRTLDSVGVYRNAIFDLAGDASDPPEALYGLKVTANLFSVLGVAPMLGRNILPEEDQPGHAEEMILSYGLWVRKFHADRGVVGRNVMVDGHTCTVIGVMSRAFNFPLRRDATHTPSPYVEFWAPLSVTLGARQGGLGAVARLRAGVSLAKARQDLDSIGSALVREFPASNRDRVLRLNLLRDRTIRGAQSGLLILMGGAVLFMLIGCSNVANLLLARGVARQREMAVRVAMGASRRRVVRQLLTESCVLAVLGGLGGYALTAIAWRILPAIAPVSIPRLAAARADSSIFGFALAVGMLNGILFGMAPALRLAWGRGFAPGGLGVRGAGGGHDRMRSVLVTAEVALAVVLVVIGGQLLGNFVRLLGTDPGFQADQILASVVLPPPQRYRDAERRSLFYRRILDAVRALPGVESAGTVDALPFSGENHGGLVSNTGGFAAHPLSVEIDVTGGEYLQTMGVRLLEGRWFREEEMAPSNESAVVSEFVAQRLWPQESAIGKRICVDCTPENPGNWRQVIGVAGNAAHAALDEPDRGNVYLAAGAMRTSDFVVVRTARPAGEMEKAIRRAIAAIDPEQPVFLSAGMRELMADSVADRRFILTLLAMTGCLALVMSAAGIYGVVSYTTSRRTQEIGIRMAVGATPGDVFSLVFRQGFVTVVCGLALGMAAALAGLRFLRTVLEGLEGGHPMPMWIAAGMVLISAAAACWMPARRATRTDPMQALREE